MPDEYIRKDTFEETMKRIEAMMAASEARISALIADNNARLEVYKAQSDAKLEVYRADSRRESESLASDIRAIKDTIDDMRHASTLRWAVFSALAAAAGAILALVPYWPAIKTVLGV